MLKFLIEAFKASKGRMPNNLEMLLLKQKAANQAIDERKIVNMFDRSPINPNKPIMGGKNIPETEDDIRRRLMKQNEQGIANLKNKLDDPEKKAMGGRIGYKFGTGKKGVEALLDLIKNKFGKKSITTADKAPIPPKTLERDMFKTADQNFKNKRMLDDDEYQDFLDEVGGADQLEAYDFDGTVGDAKRIIKEQKRYMDDMELEYKKGNLDPEPGDKSPARKRFLEKKLEEMEASGDKRLMTVDEIEELSSFDLGSEMDVAKTLAPKMVERMQLKQKYPGITDDLLDKILIDDNMQRKAEILATIDEAFKMMEKGKGADEILDTMKNVTRTKQAYGGIAGLLGERSRYQTGGDVAFDASDASVYGSSAITVTPETVADAFGNQVQQDMGNTYNPPLIEDVIQEKSVIEDTNKQGIMQNEKISGNPNGVGVNEPTPMPDRPITNLPGAEPITNLPVSDPTIRNQADIADPVTGKTIPKNFMDGFQSFFQESGAMNRPMTADVVSYRLPDGTVQQGSSTMRGLMNQYLKSIGQSPTTGVPASDRRINTNASPLAQAAMANGGRISLKNGTPKQEIVKPSDSMMVDTTTSNPMPKEKSLKENLDFVKETKGGVSPSTTMYMFKMYLDEALKKGQITKEKYNKMLMPFFGKTSEGITRDFERYEQSMAYGGRMGYESGTENPLAKLLEDIPLTKGPYKIKRDKDGKIIPPPPPLRGPYKIKRDKDGKIIPPPPPLLLRNKSANGGRINRAYGSDDLVEQASGIEGLDININPKGVKELDLRETGGFIPPVGVKEKADDIPAMLSNNEFVFTADAVRAAGGGSVNKGAQVMYDAMKKLENGGTV